MSTSTRIFLAVVAALLAVLVVYYGVLMDPPSPGIATNDDPEELHTEEELAPQPQQDVVREIIMGERVRDSHVPLEESQPPLIEVDEPQTLEELAPVDVDAAEETVGDKDVPPAPIIDDPVDEVEEEDTEADAEPTPDPAPEPQPITERPEYSEYTVRANDTMSSIAEEWFGDASKWDLIAKANPLVDPQNLRVGQVLRLPPKDAEREVVAERAGTRESTYTVRSGDTLSRIARSSYGHERHWRLIYDANRETIGANPNDLRVGMRLVIPPAPSDEE